MFALTAFVSAAEIDGTTHPADNFIGRFISDIKYSALNSEFTAYGRELGCSDTADIIRTQKNVLGVNKIIILRVTEQGIYEDSGTFTKDVLLTTSTRGFVNVFRGSPVDGTYPEHPDDSRQFLNEYWVEAGDTLTITVESRAYWDSEWYYEIYNCLTPPCYDDSDCSSEQYCEKAIVSQAIPGAGVCKNEVLTHQTQTYTCADGKKVNDGLVSDGNLRFCPDENDINYIRPGDGSTGVCLNYEPTICREVQPRSCEKDKDCSSGEVCFEKVCTEGDCTEDSDCGFEEFCLNAVCTEKEVEPAPGIDEGRINTATTSRLVESICTSKINCEEGSDCVILSKLVEEQDFSNSKSKDLREQFCEYYLEEFGGEGPFTTLAFTDSEYRNSCVALFLLENKQNYFENTFGLCITQEDKSFDLAKLTGWAAFFDITGDEGVDGLIFILGIVVLLFIISSGRRR